MRVKLKTVTAVAEAMAVLVLAGCGGGSGDEGLADALGANTDARRSAVSAAAPNVTVSARGSLAGNVGPLMTLRVNGTTVASVEVRAQNYQDYSFTVPAIPAGAKVDVVFNNDATINGQDRNLFVASITLNGTTIASTATGVTFDRGAGAKAFDGLDVLPGRRELLWDGALRFTVAATVNTAGLSPSCASFYAGKPDFALSTSRSVDPIPAMAKPARGAVFTEPTYKTCAVRVTDHVADGMQGFARNDYARIQAFNANNTKPLTISEDGFYNVFDANTPAHLKKLPSFGSAAEVQWHPSNPDLLYVASDGGSEMKLEELNVSTGAVHVVGDFEARIKALFPGSTPGQVQTGGEGSPSKDGRYWCFMVRDKDKVNQWGSKLGVGVFTWDRDTNTIVGSMPLKGEIPDHVSMSPSGEYCVVSSDGAIGTTAFTRNFGQKTQLLTNSQHSDLAIDANGRDVYVGVDNRAGPYDGDVFFADLQTGARTLLFNSYIDGTATAFHFSGKGYNKPGWVVVSSDADGCDSCGGPVRKWLHRKIMAVQLKANPVTYNLGFHRSTYDGYFTASEASVNRDFTRVVYTSNWNSAVTGDLDAYVIEIPSDTLKP
ncbi:MAG: hypothetical protein JF606_02680 [Burkholderiales bacterium]|nr:hypothetical protein [Burkholderiales bacterium]